MDAMWLYKAGNAAHRFHIPFLPDIFSALIRMFFRCVVYSQTQIGRGSTLAYGGIAVVIHRRAVIGRNVMIGQCVTVGGRSGHPELPIVEDDVYIGAGAKILGPIRIGRGAIIGANAVVLHDVPPGARVAGVPAKVL